VEEEVRSAGKKGGNSNKKKQRERSGRSRGGETLEADQGRRLAGDWRGIRARPVRIRDPKSRSRV
jgi:hypothetical protein